MSTLIFDLENFIYFYNQLDVFYCHECPCKQRKLSRYSVHDSIKLILLQLLLLRWLMWPMGLSFLISRGITLSNIIKPGQISNLTCIFLWRMIKTAHAGTLSSLRLSQNLYTDLSCDWKHQKMKCYILLYHFESYKF